MDIAIGVVLVRGAAWLVMTVLLVAVLRAARAGTAGITRAAAHQARAGRWNRFR